MASPARRISLFDESQHSEAPEESSQAVSHSQEVKIDEPPVDDSLEAQFDEPFETETPVKQSVDDAVYGDLNNVVFDKARFEELAGHGMVQWIRLLQDALGLPYETVVAELVAAVAFQLHRTMAQYTNMLSIPPMPWIGILGRPGDGKSVAIWWLKQVILEVQRRANENHDSDSATDRDSADGDHADLGG